MFYNTCECEGGETLVLVENLYYHTPVFTRLHCGEVLMLINEKERASERERERKREGFVFYPFFIYSGQ